MRKLLFAMMIGAGLTLSACEQDHPDRNRRVEVREQVPAPTPPAQTAAEARTTDAAVMRAQQATLQGYANNIVNARDRDSQLAALRQLWKFMRDHNYTYQIQATRLSDNTVVATPATSNEPLRVTMSIYEANRKLYDFQFQPMNNADLTSMTLGGT